MTRSPASFDPAHPASDAACAEEARPDEIDEEAELPPLDLTSEDETAPASVKLGAAAIRSFWKHAPKGPGVYRMIGADGEVLYVGKAKSVRKRIASYMRPSGHTNRIARMISLTVSMVFVSTATETDALLLETNYIKQMKPRFNVLMRDDKSFPYILLTGDHEAPQVTKHRGARTRKGDYFGPFASVWAVNRTLNALQRAFLLRSCTDSYYENRTRPCLLLPDQALRRSLHRGDRIRRLPRTRARDARLSVGQEPSRTRPARQGDDAGLRSAGVRARGTPARPHRRALGDPGGAGDQPQERGGGRRLRRRRAGRPVLHRGVLLPHLSELGQPRLLSQSRPQLGAGRGARRLPRPVLRRPPAAAPRAAVARGGESRAAGDGALPALRREGGDRRAAARREMRTRQGRGPQRPRDARPQALGDGFAGEAAGRPRRGFRASPHHPPRGGLRQFPHHGHARRRRHGGRRRRTAS